METNWDGLHDVSRRLEKMWSKFDYNVHALLWHVIENSHPTLGEGRCILSSSSSFPPMLVYFEISYSGGWLTKARTDIFVAPFVIKDNQQYSSVVCAHSSSSTAAACFRANVSILNSTSRLSAAMLGK